MSWRCWCQIATTTAIMTAITTTTMAITQVLDSVCLSVLDDLAMHLFYYKSGVGL